MPVEVLWEAGGEVGLVSNRTGSPRGGQGTGEGTPGLAGWPLSVSQGQSPGTGLSGKQKCSFEF